MRRSQRPAFTLIELLVVLAVIAVLAAILFPVFARAREKARAATCVAHIRQIGLAFSMYAEDYDGRFAPEFGVNIASYNELQKMWWRQIQPYLTSLAILHCPSDKITDALRLTSGCNPGLGRDPRLPALSYGANDYIVNAWRSRDFRQFQTVASIPLPSQTLLFGDSTEPWTVDFCPETDSKGVRWSHVAYANGPPECKGGYHGGHSGAGHERHTAGSNVAYVDGHVQYLPADRFICHLQGGKMVERPIINPFNLSPDD